MRGKDGELICISGDHSVGEEEEMRVSYDPITAKDRALGISEETCVPCREEIRRRAGLQLQPQPGLNQ